MSVRSKMNELIDQKQLEEAAISLGRRASEITNSDLGAVFSLIQV